MMKNMMETLTHQSGAEQLVRFDLIERGLEEDSVLTQIIFLSLTKRLAKLLSLGKMLAF